MLLSLHVSMSELDSQCSPPLSEPAKSAFLRFSAMAMARPYMESIRLAVLGEAVSPQLRAA